MSRLISKRASAAVYFAIFTSLLLEHCHCRPANEPGTTTKTKVQKLPFFGNLANPCELGSSYQNNVDLPSTSSPASVSTSEVISGSDWLHLYNSITLSLHLTINKLEKLEAADPSLPECNGLYLTSIPSLPALENLNGAEAVKEAYQMNLFLAAHFHLMSIDRQLTLSMDADLPDGQAENEVKIPIWRFRRCANESDAYPSSLMDVSGQLESQLCTILTSASEQQRVSFQGPFNRLQETTLYRYHTSCSLLQERDCLVVKAAKEAATELLTKFNSLIAAEIQLSSQTGETNAESEENDMDNTL